MTIYRKSYRATRGMRTALSLVALFVLTVGIIDYATALTPAGRALSKMQIIPAMASGAVLWLALWAAITLVFGRVYCSTVCPIGTISDAISRFAMSIPPKNALRRVFRFAPPQNRLRLGILVTTLICMIVGIFTVASVLDPFSAYTRILSLFHVPVTSEALDCVHRISLVWLSMTVAALTLGVVIVLAAWRGRLICNTLCPAGTLLGLLSNHSVMRMEINTDLCTNCRACEYACKAQCIDLDDHVVDASRCVMCFDCADVCPADAMNYRSGRHTLSLPMMQTTINKSMQTTSPQNNSEKSLKHDISKK